MAALVCFAGCRVPSVAVAESINIVGLGATRCRQFIQDIQTNPHLQRDYFAWAQGFMSGTLWRAPPSVDANLELNPPHFPLIKQVEFLRNFCEKNRESGYTDGVIELYKALRLKPF
jgi:hypothetical protein